MAEQITSPGEPTVYHHTLTAPTVDHQQYITDAEIMEDLLALQDRGYIDSDYVPIARPDGRHIFTEAELDRIAAADDDAPGPSTMQVYVTDRLLTTLEQLTAQTVDYDRASLEVLNATMAEADARKELAECEAALVDEAHKTGDLGTNDKQRAAATKVLLHTNPHAVLLRFQHEAAQSRKSRADQALGTVREQLASLRIEIPALTALLAQH